MFCSGMAAITATALSLLKQGDHAVFSCEVYGNIHAPRRRRRHTTHTHTHALSMCACLSRVPGAVHAFATTDLPRRGVQPTPSQPAERVLITACRRCRHHQLCGHSRSNHRLHQTRHVLRLLRVAV